MILKPLTHKRHMKVQRIAKLTGHKASIFTVIQGKSLNHFLSGAGDGWVIEWDMRNMEQAKVLAKIGSNIFSAQLIPERNLLVVGNMHGGVHWVDLQEKDNTNNILHHTRGVFDIRYFKGHIYTAGGQGKFTKWNIETQLPIETIQLTQERLRSIDFSEKRNEILIGASDNAMYLLDADTFQVKKQEFEAHENSVFVAKYSPDQKYIFSGGRDAQLRVWDIETLREVSTQAAHWFTINDLVFHPNGKWFATASRDKTIKIWDTTTFKLLKVIEVIKLGGHVNSVNKLYWSSHENWLISCSDDRTVMVWEIL